MAEVNFGKPTLTVTPTTATLTVEVSGPQGAGKTTLLDCITRQLRTKGLAITRNGEHSISVLMPDPRDFRLEPTDEEE